MPQIPLVYLLPVKKSLIQIKKTVIFNVLYCFFKWTFIKGQKVTIETHIAPNLFTLMYLCELLWKQKSNKSYRTFKCLLWGILVYKVKKSNVIIDSPLLPLFKSLFLAITTYLNAYRNYQNKCICFSSRLDKMNHISFTDFKLINCLPTRERLNQCIIQ